MNKINKKLLRKRIHYGNIMNKKGIIVGFCGIKYFQIGE